MISEHWPRWVFASIADHFDSALSAELPLFIEGQSHSTTEDTDRAELRVDGPRITHIGKADGYEIYVEVNILIQHVMGDTDWQNLQKYQGLVAAAFTNIQIYRYGDPLVAENDESLAGCMKLIEPLDINNFGQVAPDSNLQQGTVEGRYKMTLEEE